jgi:hypothetical protein
MENEVYYEDRSGAETDDKCGMAYFWSRLYGSRGISPRVEAAALRVGGDTHEDLAFVATQPEEQLTPESLNQQVNLILSDTSFMNNLNREQMEVLYRRLGWLVAFALYMEPRIRKDYETISIEKELILDRYPLWVGVTPDRVLRHREGGFLRYLEYKTTISASQKWVASWSYAIQLHLGIAAVQEEIEEKVKFAQIMGLIKGDHRGGKLSHPYVWGWRRGDQWEHEYAKARSAGWEPAPVWEYPGGIVEWVMRLGAEEASQQFPHSYPVTLNEKMLEEWVARRTYRQKVIALVADDCQNDLDQRNLYFEKRTRSCRPAFGDACPFLLACWNAAAEANPLATGDYVEREPHHDIELQLEGGME